MDPHWREICGKFYQLQGWGGGRSWYTVHLYRGFGEKDKLLQLKTFKGQKRPMELNQNNLLNKVVLWKKF